MDKSALGTKTGKSLLMGQGKLETGCAKHEAVLYPESGTGGSSPHTRRESNTDHTTRSQQLPGMGDYEPASWMLMCHGRHPCYLVTVLFQMTQRFWKSCQQWGGRFGTIQVDLGSLLCFRCRLYFLRGSAVSAEWDSRRIRNFAFPLDHTTGSLPQQSLSGSKMTLAMMVGVNYHISADLTMALILIRFFMICFRVGRALAPWRCNSG